MLNHWHLFEICLCLSKIQSETVQNALWGCGEMKNSPHWSYLYRKSTEDLQLKFKGLGMKLKCKQIMAVFSRIFSLSTLSMQEQKLEDMHIDTWLMT